VLTDSDGVPRADNVAFSHSAALDIYTSSWRDPQTFCR
jgi:hypothetical protein